VTNLPLAEREGVAEAEMAKWATGVFVLELALRRLGAKAETKRE